MLEAYDDSFRNMAEGEVVKGTVLKVTKAAVVVDVGYKSEGLIPIHEFLDENGNVTVQAGDTVDVLLERTEDREGHIVLSREKAEKMKIWDEVEKAYADRKVVIGRVIDDHVDRCAWCFQRCAKYGWIPQDEIAVREPLPLVDVRDLGRLLRTIVDRPTDLDPAGHRRCVEGWERGVQVHVRRAMCGGSRVVSIVCGGPG